MKVRKALAKDIPGIVALINQNLDKLLPREQIEVERLLPSFFVLDDSTKIIGCCCLEIYSSKIAEIRSVGVESSLRGRGYGTMLMEAAIAEAKRQNILEIMVITSNLEFYQKLNFSTCMNEKYALFYRQ